MAKPEAGTAARILGGQTEEQLLNSFFVLYKTCRMVDENNATFVNQFENFRINFDMVAKKHQQVTIKIVASHYFVNDTMVRFNDQGLSGAAGVIAEWRKLGLGGIRVAGDASADEIRSFFRFITSIRPDNDNLESLAERLRTHGLTNVELLSMKAVDTDRSAISEEARQRFRVMARKTFFRAMNVVEEVMVSTDQGRDINVAKTKRVVHSLIDQLTRDESSLIELTAIRNFDNYTYAHSTNVAVYSLTLGIRIGLDRTRLSQLGFAALFHDIGKVKLPTDLVKKPDAFDENDWLQMQRHPLLGAKTILRNLKFDTHTARAARAAFEHHINNDLTGYPMLHYKRREPGLFSKIISIVDTFDALTSGRVYLKKNLAPDVVFKKMRYQMTVKFDPFLMQLFNDIIGTYPAGTLVLLTSNEIALVLTNNEDKPACPIVKIVGNTEGILEEPIWADLASPEHNDRRVVRQIDPDRYSLNVSDFVLS
ncbi:MAG: HD domain-containing protein [candidate division Zixibacteria bacterium]|nr:HD domain-containing protein [candidate division Zixibacteria bacterium]